MEKLSLANKDTE
jgi:hypothetical protein